VELLFFEAEYLLKRYYKLGLFPALGESEGTWTKSQIPPHPQKNYPSPLIKISLSDKCPSEPPAFIEL
jgi:hypothetical protein